MPDPLLKTAAEEIKAILKKHDIAGMMMLQSPGGAEFVRVIDPKWSCVKIQDTPMGPAIRIKAHHSEFPSKEAQKVCVEWTIGMVFAFHHQAEQDMKSMAQLIEILSRQFDISNWIRDDNE